MNKIIFDNKTVVPNKVICIGRNYVEHVKELNNEMPDSMVIFNKPNSAITNELKYFNANCRFEGELCLIIKNKGIAGVGLGLDLTHADIQNRQKQKGLPWERAKAFDGSAVLSRFIPLNTEIENISFELYHNDILSQKANYGLMIYKPKEIIDEIDSFMSLEDGDIIMTGTPKGVGGYEQGDKFTMKLYDNEDHILEVIWVAK